MTVQEITKDLVDGAKHPYLTPREMIQARSHGMLEGAITAFCSTPEQIVARAKDILAARRAALEAFPIWGSK